MSFGMYFKLKDAVIRCESQNRSVVVEIAKKNAYLYLLYMEKSAMCNIGLWKYRENTQTQRHRLYLTVTKRNNERHSNTYYSYVGKMYILAC